MSEETCEEPMNEKPKMADLQLKMADSTVKMAHLRNVKMGEPLKITELLRRPMKRLLSPFDNCKYSQFKKTAVQQVNDEDIELVTLPSWEHIPETFGELKHHMKYNDYIFDFAYLKLFYKDRVGVEIYDYRWLVHDTDDHLVFYILHVANDTVRVSTCISVKKTMEPVIALNGINVNRLDYCARVPVIKKIIKWDQLKNLLVSYGFKRHVF